MFDAELYREKVEVDAWKKKGPLVVLQKRLEEAGLWEQIDTAAIEEEVDRIVDDAVSFAENGTLEPPEELERFVYTEVAP